MKKSIIWTLLAGAILAAILWIQPRWSQNKANLGPVTDLVIYTSRKEHLVKPLFEAFEKYWQKEWPDEPALRIQFFTSSSPSLIQKLLAEKSNSPADIFMTVDAGNLYEAQRKKLLAATSSVFLESEIPAHLRDSEGHWYGFSLRARTIFYNKKLVKPAELKGLTYSSLGDPQWKRRLCLRTSKKVYNQSLVASLIFRYKERRTEATIQSWIKNLAVPVFSSDTLLLEAIQGGICHLGIANTYYYGRLVKSGRASAVKLFWPSRVHVNISGAGIVRHSPHPKEALAFLEWLARPQAQKMLAQLNLEYPVVGGVPLDPVVKDFGPFTQDTMHLREAGRLQPQAVRLMDRVGYH